MVGQGSDAREGDEGGLAKQDAGQLACRKVRQLDGSASPDSPESARKPGAGVIDRQPR